MKRPRCGGCRIVWAIYELYDIMMLTTWKGQRSKWGWNSLPGWKRCMSKHFGDDCFLYSKHGNASPTKNARDNSGGGDKILPQLGASSLALCTLLSRWAHSGMEKGGFKNELHRLASADILKAIVSLAFVGGPPCVVTVVFNDSWRCAWPRPSCTIGDDSVNLEVRDGELLLRPFCSMVGLSHSKVAVLWHRLFFGLQRPDVGDECCRPFDTVLQQSQGCEALGAFTAQLVWALARQLEARILGSKVASDSCPSVLSVKSRTISIHDLDMEAKLHSYVVGCRARSAAHNTISVATDKASPRGLSLQNTTITFSDNCTIVCCPNVAVGPRDRGPRAVGRRLELADLRSAVRSGIKCPGPKNAGSTVYAYIFRSETSKFIRIRCSVLWRCLPV